MVRLDKSFTLATLLELAPIQFYFEGTLKYQLTDPRTAELFAQTWDNSTSNWTVLDDVKVT